MICAGPSASQEGKKKEDSGPQLARLSEELSLDELWWALGQCLKELAKTADHHAVLILQPAVEAFFIVHAGEKEKVGAFADYTEILWTIDKKQQLEIFSVSS